MRHPKLALSLFLGAAFTSGCGVGFSSFDSVRVAPLARALPEGELSPFGRMSLKTFLGGQKPFFTQFERMSWDEVNRRYPDLHFPEQRGDLIVTVVVCEGPFPDLAPGASGSIGQRTATEFQTIIVFIDEVGEAPIGAKYIPTEAAAALQAKRDAEAQAQGR